jgi:prevent-host-death family protein
MAVTISSAAFNQDAAGAKRAVNHRPVFITVRGRPAHVLLSIK